jgi:hypothetical protein
MALNPALLVVTVAKLTTTLCTRAAPAAHPVAQAALSPMSRLAGPSRAAVTLSLLLLPPSCALPSLCCPHSPWPPPSFVAAIVPAYPDALAPSQLKVPSLVLAN